MHRFVLQECLYEITGLFTVAMETAPGSGANYSVSYYVCNTTHPLALTYNYTCTLSVCFVLCTLYTFEHN